MQTTSVREATVQPETQFPGHTDSCPRLGAVSSRDWLAGFGGPCGPAGSIYRPFFLAGLLIILTVSAGWGVLLLLKIGSGGSFTGVTVHEINAHGHAQVLGWVGGQRT